MMDDREFLKKIRRIQEREDKINLTNLPVGMDELIHKNKQEAIVKLIKESRILKEEEIQTIEPDEQRDEESKFKDVVSKLVKFEPIKVHKENVEWSGHLIREKIDWYFSLDDTTGCYINTSDLIQLRDETLEVLKKLRGYYDVWSDEWSSRLTGVPSEESGETEAGAPEEGLGTEEGFGTEESGF